MTETLERVALEAAAFRALRAFVPATWFVPDSETHSSDRIFTRERDGGACPVSAHHVSDIANGLVRVLQMVEGDDPQGRARFVRERAAEITAALSASKEG